MNKRKMMGYKLLWGRYEDLDQKQIDLYDPKDTSFFSKILDKEKWDDLQRQKIAVLEEMTQMGQVKNSEELTHNAPMLIQLESTKGGDKL